MKKQYKAPLMEVIRIERTLLISGSLSDPATDPARSREYEVEDF